MTHAQWLELSRQHFLNHIEVRWAIDRRTVIDPCAALKAELAEAEKGHRARAHLRKRLIELTTEQLRLELAA